jgi:hypothetical protein
MKLIESIKQIITEASKKQILMDKIGFNEENADILDTVCGPLSVWMAKKVMGFQQDVELGWGKPASQGQVLVDKMNSNRFITGHRGRIQSIMDWIRVGLNGNVNPYKDLTFKELQQKSEEWHNSLEVGQGDINYRETNPILLDFRDEDGNGFYWADLETKSSEAECERMGHCGRSSYGYLYSLRQVIPINNKYKLNKSVLTAAIGEDGIMYQLKGVKNSKPDEKYQQYILPLFYVLGGSGEEEDYLIQGFGTEYASEQDFKLSDLPEQTIKDLYQNRPELFSSRTMQRLLGKMGIVDAQPLPTTFTLDITPDDFYRYIDGGTYNSYTNRTTGVVKRVSIFEEIMEGDAWNLWGHHDNEDLGSYFQYVMDKPTEEKIWAIVRDMAQRDGIELDEELDLEDAINEVDNDYEIKNAIGSAINDADADDYVNHLQDEIKSALEFYGNVSFFNSDGAKIQIDLSSLVDVDDEDIDVIFEDNLNKLGGGYNLEGVLDTLISEDYIEKPDYSPDDRWYPSPDYDIVNENVNYRLDDISI